MPLQAVYVPNGNETWTGVFVAFIIFLASIAFYLYMRRRYRR